MKIAILYICTGKYVVFWTDFYKSAERFLLPGYEKHYYVFTDTFEIDDEKNPRIHKIKQKVLEWPFSTLMRFNMFLDIENELNDYNYVYFFNANMLLVAPIGEEILPSVEEGGLLVVQHPGFYNQPKDKYTYERNPHSLAYIAEDEGEYYVAGGLNGGQSKSFLTLIKTLKSNIDKDLENGIIAIWHDV